MIDAFRLVCEKNTSGHVYVRELAISLVEMAAVSRVVLIVPKDPDSQVMSYFDGYDDISFHKESVGFDPAASWWQHTKWIQLHVARAIKSIQCFYAQVGELYFIAPYHQTPVSVSKSIRRLAVIHDLCGLDAASGYRRFSRPYLRHVFNFFTAIKYADILLPISDFTKKEMERCYPSSKVKLTSPAYNSVTTKRLSSDEITAAIDGMNLPASYFVAFSAMGPRKGTDISLLSYKLYKQQGGVHKLLMIGSKTANLFWQDYADRHDVHDITWLTGISDIQRDAIYATAESLLFPSRCEGFGYPIVEAMRQACPIIAWKNSPADEILQGAQDLLATIDVDEVSSSMRSYDNCAETQRAKLGELLVEKSYCFAKSNLGAEFVAALTGKGN